MQQREVRGSFGDNAFLLPTLGSLRLGRPQMPVDTESLPRRLKEPLDKVDEAGSLVRVE